MATPPGYRCSVSAYLPPGCRAEALTVTRPPKTRTPPPPQRRERVGLDQCSYSPLFCRSETAGRLFVASATNEAHPRVELPQFVLAQRAGTEPRARKGWVTLRCHSLDGRLLLTLR